MHIIDFIQPMAHIHCAHCANIFISSLNAEKDDFNIIMHLATCHWVEFSSDTELIEAIKQRWGVEFTEPSMNRGCQ